MDSPYAKNRRPSVQRLERGAFCLSFDVELAWGIRDYPRADEYRKRFARAREIVPLICNALERFAIPATWAFVGHLMLHACGPFKNGRKHPEIERPDGLAGGEDWFAPDPCSSVECDPDYYAPDLLRRILACATPQEIALHSFSHIRFDERRISGETARAELDAARKAAAAHGLSPTSFIFPCNVQGFHGELLSAGMTSFRGDARDWYGRVPRPLAKPAQFADHVLGISPAVGAPCRHESGLWDLPASMFLMSFDGPARWIPARARLRKAQRGLRQAARTRGLFHLWSHPHNFYREPERMLPLLERILEHAAHERDSGRLDTLTMAQLATRLESAQR